MSEDSTLSQAERDRYLAYDERRRQTLLRVMIPAGAALAGLASLVATITIVVAPHQDASVWVNDAITLSLVGLFLGARRAMRQGSLMLASALVVGAGGIAVLATVAIAGFSQGLTPLTLIQLASLTILVVLVGMLGNLVTILGAAALLSLVTLSLLLWAPRPPALVATIQAQLPLLASVSITYQWGVATLMVAIWLTYRQTLSALGTAYERSQQLDNLKAQFITHINHELRTPIMTLQGYVEYLRLGGVSLPQEEVESALDGASRSADTLVVLLNNILDIRRIEANEVIEPEPVPVRDALEAALALVDPRLGSQIPRDVHLGIPDGLVVWGDPVRLQQILINLLSNAVKYSAPGTPIEVSGRVVAAGSTAPGLSLRREWPRDASESRPVGEISVRDYGHGIPPDQIPLLFNRFARLPRELASPVSGSGLGLYLCRVFAEGMGGTIRAESTGTPGEGSTFRLRLPLPPIRRRPEAPLAASTRSSGWPQGLQMAADVTPGRDQTPARSLWRMLTSANFAGVKRGGRVIPAPSRPM
jgi:signal transduction histidine kinase